RRRHTAGVRRRDRAVPLSGAIRRPSMRRLSRLLGSLFGIEVPTFVTHRRLGVRPGAPISDAGAETGSALRLVIVVGVHALGALTVATPAFAAPDDVARAREVLVEAATVASGTHDAGSDVRSEIAAAQARAGDVKAAFTTAASTGRWVWRSVAIGFAA